MNTKSAILVALLVIVALHSRVNVSAAAAPGELDAPCKGWIGGSAPFTFCSDKLCDLPAMFFISRCNGGLNCCIGSGSITTTTTTSATSATATTATTKATTPQPAPKGS